MGMEGVPLDQLKAAGFTFEQFMNYGFNRLQLKAAGFSQEEIDDGVEVMKKRAAEARKKGRAAKKAPPKAQAMPPPEAHPLPAAPALPGEGAVAGGKGAVERR